MAKLNHPPFNNWERVREYREQLDSGKYPALNDLAQCWNQLEPQVGAVVDRERFLDKNEPSRTPLEQLVLCVEMGVLPPPELLLALVDTLRVYEGGRGKLDLEELLFGAPIRSVGNHSARRAKDFDFMLMDFHITIHCDQNTSLIERVESFLAANNIEADPASVLRKYQRWKKERTDAHLEKSTTD